MRLTPRIKKILILAANPQDTDRLRLDKEVREIEEGLRRSKHREKFEIKERGAVRIKDLQRAFLDEDPQIVHFSGHGDREGILLEDEKGDSTLVNIEALTELFEILAARIECVVLNACYSETQADAICKHIPYVIGMKKAIGDEAAIDFSIGFYDGIGADQPIEMAFRLGCNAIRLKNIPEHLIPTLKTNPNLTKNEKEPETTEPAADPKALMSNSLSTSATLTLSKTMMRARPSGKSNLLLIVAITISLFAVAGITYSWFASSASRPPASGIQRVQLKLSPADNAFGLFTISPDGTIIAFTAQSGATRQIFRRPIGGHEAISISGSMEGFAPFFSPDGHWIGFLSREAIWKVNINGGTPIKICKASYPWHASWGDNGKIVFDQPLSENPWQLMQVSASGGQPQPLILSPPNQNTYAVRPEFLPGSRAVLYQSFLEWGNMESSSIVVYSLEDGENHTVLQTGITPSYSQSGHIIYSVSNNLMAIPFDLNSLKVNGSANIVEEDIYVDLISSVARYCFSQNGTLLYAKSGQASDNELVWVDRQGRETPISGVPHLYWDPRLSPDNNHLAVNARDEGRDIWVLDMERSALSRLTFNSGEDETAFWSPDGKWIAFSSSRTGQPRSVFKQFFDGSGEAERLWTSEHHMHVDSWSVDGKMIILTEMDPNTLEDLWALKVIGKLTAKPLLQTPFRERNGRISPNGRWVAYESNESGQNEVYVQAFPELGKKTQISTRGGSQPVWSKDGKELFYRGNDQIMSIDILPGKTFSISTPRALFKDRYALKAEENHIGYDVSNDGQQFIMIKDEPQTVITYLEVVFNWFDEVNKKVPVRR